MFVINNCQLRENTSMKIVIKGVMRVDDALACIQNKVDGIWVSNHGGRQLDSVPATIEVLSEICQAVAGRMEVYMDGGIVRGTDVLKAIALGATAVFIGRPILWYDDFPNHTFYLVYYSIRLPMKRLFVQSFVIYITCY
jgi:isopentenyl diphosphate isomerase/L-lactate dehydrogenase-like FMN-dependent dehydrogenase